MLAKPHIAILLTVLTATVSIPHVSGQLRPTSALPADATGSLTVTSIPLSQSDTADSTSTFEVSLRVTDDVAGSKVETSLTVSWPQSTQTDLEPGEFVWSGLWVWCLMILVVWRREPRDRSSLFGRFCVSSSFRAIGRKL